jgi:beta-N-acetylhexosaminidase
MARSHGAESFERPNTERSPQKRSTEMQTPLDEGALRRLANSVVWPGFRGRLLPGWAEDALRDGLAGLVYFEQNIGGPHEVRALSARIHELNPVSLIGVDEEGGIVTRLESRDGSSTPGNAVLGRADDVALSESVAAWTGALVASAGIDVDLAPTVDVNVDPRNPVIGVRSFGADADLVSRHTTAAVRGLQSAGVAACAKHYPGHGDTSTDSHLALAVSNATDEQFTDVHLKPFSAAIDAGVKAVMTAHLRVPQLGDEPATLNPRALGLLRSLGFTGVIVSDALDMAAIRHTVGMGPGAVLALQAGVDLLCVGNPASNPAHPDGPTDEMEFLEVRDAIVAAMRSGELPTATVEEAAGRVAALSAWVRSQARPNTVPAAPALAAVTAAALEVAGRPTLRPGVVTVVDARTKRNIAVGAQEDHFTRALGDYREVERVWLTEVGGVEGAARRASEVLGGAAVPVLVVNQVQSNELEAGVLDAVLTRRPDTVVIVAGWPAPVDVAAPAGAPPANAVFAYGSARVNAKAVARILCA